MKIPISVRNCQITIGMPVCNGQKHVAAAIHSLLGQTFSDFELLISDDCSSDNSLKICRRLAKQDRRIKVFRQQKRLGAAANLNFVLGQAKSPYFVWAAQDDLRHRDFLKTLLYLHEKNIDSVAACCNYENFSGDKREKKKIEGSLDWFLRTGDLGLVFGLHKTAVLKKIGGYQIDSRPFFGASDYLTIFRELLEGKFAVTDKTLFYKRDSGLYFSRFEVFKQKKFNKIILLKMLRYISFPISFIYNFVYSVKYTVFSDLPIAQKLRILFLIMLAYFKSNFEFLINILKGIIFFIIPPRFFPHREWNSPDTSGNILAFMNAFTSGASGGDIAMIEIIKRLPSGTAIRVVTSLLGKKLCRMKGLKAEYLLTSHEKEFKHVIWAYFKRTIYSVCCVWSVKSDIIYVSSDALPDILPAYILKIKNKNAQWIQKIYHRIPAERRLSHFFQNLSWRLIKNRADSVITATDSMAKMLTKHGFDINKIKVNPLGIDAKKIGKVEPNKSNFDAVMIGRLHPGKNITEAVEIWRKAVDKIPAAKLAIIGSGDEKFIKEIKNIIKSFRLQENIKLLGFLPDEKVIAHLKSAKIFVAPSQEEGFGLAVLEAAACGLPIVAYDLPVYQNFKSAMLFAPQNDVHHFVSNIIKLLSNTAMRKKLSANALKLAKIYSWEKTARREFFLSF